MCHYNNVAVLSELNGMKMNYNTIVETWKLCQLMDFFFIPEFNMQSHSPSSVIKL